jgi:hypothetical protein
MVAAERGEACCNAVLLLLPRLLYNMLLVCIAVLPEHAVLEVQHLLCVDFKHCELWRPLQPPGASVHAGACL